jgi:1-acyl-sn-glycerol-3-phosphate acyltransferase
MESVGAYPVRSLPPKARAAYRAVSLLAKLRTRIEGSIPAIPGDAPCIFAFNHNDAAETLFAAAIAIKASGGRLVSFMVDWMFARAPLLGRIISLCEPILVYGKRARWAWLRRLMDRPASYSSVDEALSRLKSGAWLGIFPEGTRRGKEKCLGKPRKGLYELSRRSGALVLPVGIEKRPWPLRRVFRFGAPIELWRETDPAKAGDIVMKELSRLSRKPYREHEEVPA